ncbi:hypothetical protein HCJ66_11395 [Listeria sp. FSL L7-1582]|uniref:hypothetical protein n=1 Tax=Listeria portnoyi TaxID=2713504 RepID=UPI00164EC8DB|nr:hypothetical protein [Listeria portnoyi]MBC6310142.1 hypothetical protein [Listeria portnoyi]
MKKYIVTQIHTLLLLAGVFFMTLSAFLVHIELGFLVLGLFLVLLALYINYESKEGG